jgi:hypothetical protein
VDRKAAAEVNDRVYSLGELIALGSPLPLEPDFAVCDVLGCGGSAAFLIPGAAVCRPCWEERLDGEGRYHISFHDMVSAEPDSPWRRARLDEYRERLCLMGPRRRDAVRDSILDELVARRVELFLMFDLDPQ